MKLKQIFEDRELHFGLPQSSGNMIVIPIISELDINDVSSDMMFNITNDSDYAHLTLKNDDELPVIVPQGTAYMNKQSAQDRVILSANVIGKQAKRVNVGCIESGQCGHMKVGTEEERYLSATLRGAAMDKDTGARHSQYGVIWDDIEKFNRKLNVSGRSHIRDFYEKFQNDLEFNIGQFEIVENQIGAIIIINNKIAGIKIYPNRESWNKVWRKLLRDSYLADALALTTLGKALQFRPMIDVDKVNSIEDLETQTSEILISHNENMMSIIEPVIDITTTKDSFDNQLGFSISNFLVKELRGQIVEKENKVMYLTAVAKVV